MVERKRLLESWVSQSPNLSFVIRVVQTNRQISGVKLTQAVVYSEGGCWLLK